MQKSTYLQALYGIFFLFFFHSICAQGSIPMHKKSFKGALEFLPKGKLADGSARVKMASPNEVDPMLDPEKWYGTGNEQMRGFVGDAVLFLEWWTTMENPSERYKFDWTSSGHFDLKYVDGKGNPLQKRIERQALSKYPNLAQRFDNIMPVSISFEFTFHSADIPEQQYRDFRKKYRILEDLGSAGYSVNFTRELDGTTILYSPSGRLKQWTTPGFVFGNWDTFLNIPDKYDDIESRLIELFRLGKSLSISSFRIKEISWNLNDFVTIARKFDDYESGKDKDDAFDEVEKCDHEKKAGDGDWDSPDLLDSETEVYRDPTSNLNGIKSKKGKILSPPLYDQIVKSSIEKFYIAKKGKTIFILNNMGKEVSSRNFNEYPSIGTCGNGKLWASVQTNNSHNQEYDFDVASGDKYFYQRGIQTKSIKWYRDSYFPRMSLLVESDNYGKQTQAEKEAERIAYQEYKERHAKERTAAMNQAASGMKSQGYVEDNEAACN